jgi:hypothetical protein
MAEVPGPRGYPAGRALPPQAQRCAAAWNSARVSSDSGLNTPTSSPVHSYTLVTMLVPCCCVQSSQTTFCAVGARASGSRRRRLPAMARPWLTTPSGSADGVAARLSIQLRWTNLARVTMYSRIVPVVCMTLMTYEDSNNPCIVHNELYLGGYSRGRSPRLAGGQSGHAPNGCARVSRSRGRSSR